MEKIGPFAAMCILAENCIFGGSGIPLGIWRELPLLMNNAPTNTLQVLQHRSEVYIQFTGPRPTKGITAASKAARKSDVRMRGVKPRLRPERQGCVRRKRPPQTKILITWAARHFAREECFEGQSQWLGRWTGGIQAAASNYHVRSAKVLLWSL